MSTPLNIFLNALADTTGKPAKPSGNCQWFACCPAHDDRSPSLSIGEGDDGRVLLNCHAGCTSEAIVQSVGLEMTDLFPESNEWSPNMSKSSKHGSTKQTKPCVDKPSNCNEQPSDKKKRFKTPEEAIQSLEHTRGKASTKWPYYRNGELDGYVLRWDLPGDKKNILPVSRHGDDWVIGAMKEPRPLLHEDELAEADQAIVCEGEKACDAAISLGYTATTSSGGSGAAIKSDWSSLAAKDVAILRDNDDAGLHYAEDVTDEVHKYDPSTPVLTVLLPGLPEGGDIRDYVDQRRASGADDATIRREVDEQIAEDTPLVLESEDFKDDDGWPEPPDEAAFSGLAGKVVGTIEPHSEADKAGLLAQFLVAFGSVIGRAAHFQVEGDQHFGNLFALMIGDTSSGRKGTSWGQIKRLLDVVDPDWIKDCVIGGLSSGEGLIWAVRDEIVKQEPIRSGGKVTGYQDVIEDPGVADKRLMAMEPEFARLLRAMKREANTLSAIIRQAWDSGNLRITTKSSPARATDAHISIVGHITGNELRCELTDTSMANGFFNRFLPICVRRSKYLPLGGSLGNETIQALADEVREAVEYARTAGEIEFDGGAETLWCDEYKGISNGPPGLLGAATSRAAPQIRRLAMSYALLDRSNVVRVEHLRAAMALWDYVRRSAAHVFGDDLGDPVADKIRHTLKRKPKGMSRTEVVELFNKHVSAADINRAIRLLKKYGHIREEENPTGGRSETRYFAVRRTAKEAKKADQQGSAGTSFASFAPPAQEISPTDGEWDDV